MTGIDPKRGSSVTQSRCPRCGRPSIVAGKCQACDHAWAAHVSASSVPLRLNALLPSAQSLQVVRPRTMNNTHRALPVASVLHGTSVVAQTVAVEPQDTFNDNIVRGRVLLSLQEATQPADFDLWRWISVPIWGLVLFFLPFAAVIAVWQYAGFLYAMVVGFIFVALLRFIFSGRLMQSWMFISALHGRHVVEPMPVTMLRVRVGNSQEVQLRLKGHLTGGSATVGDRIMAQGRWRYNVLHVSRLYCERTGAWTLPIQPCALRSAISGTVILSFMALWLYLVGIPWVQNQVPGFLRHQYQGSSALIYHPVSEENAQIKPSILQP